MEEDGLAVGSDEDGIDLLNVRIPPKTTSIWSRMVNSLHMCSCTVYVSVQIQTCFNLASGFGLKLALNIVSRKPRESPLCNG